MRSLKRIDSVILVHCNRRHLEKQFSSGSDAKAIPNNIPLLPWKKGSIKGAFTGPNVGLTQLDAKSEVASDDRPSVVAGVANWCNPTEYAYGTSVSLYETDKEHDKQVGDPIADVFGIVVRENNAILAVADGSGWGKKPRLAARCAVNAAITHISENIDKLSTKKPTSSILSKLLYDSMEAAHQSILSHGGTLTTLSVAVACQLDYKSELWGLFVASVGDSPVFVFCPHTQQVFEVTVDCHPKDGSRQVQLSGGALGPAIGTLPDLENLSIAYTPVYPGDIILIMSDGVSDNFSPSAVRSLQEDKLSDDDSGIIVVTPTGSPSIVRRPPIERHIPASASPLLTRCCPSPSNPHTHEIQWPTCDVNLHRSISHSVSPNQPLCDDKDDSVQLIELKKCCENVPELTKFLQHHQNELLDNMTAQTATSAIINYVYEVTEKKRMFKSECLDKGINVSRRKRADPEFAKKLQTHTSKLDHATVVSYCVGLH